MKRKGMKTLAALLSAALMVTMMPPNAAMAAKASKKVKLSSKKITLTVGKKKTLKLKNNKKKVKWTVKSGKTKIKLKSKKKTSVVIVAKKAGTAKVQAKVGKKKYVCKVVVKKKAVKATKAPAKNTNTTSTKAPGNTTPTKAPAESVKPVTPVTPTAVPSPTPNYVVTGIEGKDAAEVREINTLVTAQLAAEATVPTDLNSSRYKWNADGKLTELNWSGCDVVGKGMNDFSSFAQLEKLDVSGNSGITGTFYTNGLTNLTELKCYDTKIDKLELDNNKKLAELDCHSTSLSGDLDVSENTALERLYCSDNKITTLDVTTCAKLEMLFCKNNMITSLKANDLKSLKELDCSNNYLVGDDVFSVTGDSALTKLDCSYNVITKLDLTGLTSLLTLDCYGEEVEDGSADGDEMTILLSDCTELKELDCSYQPMLSLDLTDMSKLEKVLCAGCGIETLLLAGNDALNTLDCSYNGLELLEIPGENSLEVLDSSSNEFMEVIDLTAATELTALDVSDTSLTSLDVSKCLKLEILLASYSLMPDTNDFDETDTGEGDTGDDDTELVPELILDVSANTALKELYLDSTELTDLILPETATTETLDVADSYIMSITNLDKQTSLKILSIAFSALENLDFSANTALEQLYCDEEQQPKLVGVDPGIVKVDEYAGGDDTGDEGDEGDDTTGGDAGEDSGADAGEDTGSESDAEDATTVA